MNKAELLATLREKRAEWDVALAAVPHERMTEPGVAGEWSVKDLVAHLSMFELWYADRLDENLRGVRYTPVETDWSLSFDERNALNYQKNRDRDLEDVLDESRSAFRRLLAGVESNDEAFLIEPQQFPGAPGPIVVWQMLRGDVYDHYGEHIASIRAWMHA